MEDQIVMQALSMIEKLGVIGGYALMGAGALTVLGYGYIKLTPTQDDDQWLQKMEAKAWVGSLLRALKAYSPIQRKEK